MGLKKGQCNNLAGRKKGTPNRTTYEMKLAFQTILDLNVEQMEVDLKELTAKERLTILLKLADFVIPKVQSTLPDDSESIYQQKKLMQKFYDNQQKNSENTAKEQ